LQVVVLQSFDWHDTIDDWASIDTFVVVRRVLAFSADKLTLSPEPWTAIN